MAAAGDAAVPDAAASGLSGHALALAPRLLGCLLRVGEVTVRLVEVEAYEGSDDPASHAWRGPTRRNEVMFGPPGRLYVYVLHTHACANVVCGPEGLASAVLLLAGEVTAGLDVARGRRPGVRDPWLARGPGNLCRALGLTLADNGADLAGPRVALLDGPPPAHISAGPRVNVARASERPWRFWDADSTAVSAYKAHPGARTPA